jgi:hypothetical protein
MYEQAAALGDVRAADRLNGNITGHVDTDTIVQCDGGGDGAGELPHIVTDLQGPPLERTQTEKLRDLKKLAQHYARDRGSCDDIQISYLESLEERDNDNLRLAQMLAG